MRLCRSISYRRNVPLIQNFSSPASVPPYPQCYLSREEQHNCVSAPSGSVESIYGKQDRPVMRLLLTQATDKFINLGLMK